MTDKANCPYPYMGINGEYFSKEFLESVESDIVKKIPIWQANLIDPTPCERFAYHVLKQIKFNDWKF